MRDEGGIKRQMRAGGGMPSAKSWPMSQCVFGGTADVVPRPFAVAREKTISNRRRIQ